MLISSLHLLQNGASNVEYRTIQVGLCFQDGRFCSIGLGVTVAPASVVKQCVDGWGLLQRLLASVVI